MNEKRTKRQTDEHDKSDPVPLSLRAVQMVRKVYKGGED